MSERAAIVRSFRFVSFHFAVRSFVRNVRSFVRLSFLQRHESADGRSGTERSGTERSGTERRERLGSRMLGLRGFVALQCIGVVY